MDNVSGFGFSAHILATNTFPVGFTVTKFADDTDPLDVPGLAIAGSAMGLNGDLIVWTTASPIACSIAIIAGSADERNLSLLFEANRAGKNKASAQDEIQMVLTYPNATFVTLIKGKCIEFMPAKNVASEGRFKSMTYSFIFENRIGL